MNKKMLALAALPVVFGAAGFAAGKVIGPAPEVAAPVAAAAKADRTTAEQALDRLSGEDAHVTPAAHGAEHEAKLIPASATVPETHAADHSPAKATKVKTDAHGAAAATHPQAHAKTAPAMHGGSAQVVEGKGMMSARQIKDSKVVKLGRITVPVQRPNSVTYVVTDIGVSVHDLEAAAHFNVAENATRLRDAILMSMHRVAGTQMMKGPTIDTQELSETLSSDLRAGFGEKLDEVLFLSLVKADVPRS